MLKVGYRDYTGTTEADKSDTTSRAIHWITAIVAVFATIAILTGFAAILSLLHG